MRLINSLVMAILGIMILSCKIKTYPTYYYLLFPYLREGLNRPEKVRNIQVKKQDYLIVEITWEPSKDPELNRNVPYYFIYLYYEYPKENLFYDKKYLFDIVSEPKYVLFLGNFRGSIFLVITAYDLGAESEVSDIIKIDQPF
ncbi:MAG: hypothetical protein NZ853_03740 [Leptospiraceae bacterium]|nr:hypothetical protein [Leptospiraceae bacterium]MDW7975287.1 hypothetical protein [Leptospiraceae bacterium]